MEVANATGASLGYGTHWQPINWESVYRNVRRLQTRIVKGEVRVYHVPRLSLSGLGLASVTHSSADRGVRSHGPDTNGHLPFGPSLSASLACSQ